MYIPEAFKEDRIEVLSQAIADIQFAALVSPTAQGIEITHVPMVLKHADDKIILEAHLARANPHWDLLRQGQPSVAIFQGPHAYVSPSWYPTKAKNGKVVPTWAYIAVHAHGVAVPVQDETWLRTHMDDLTQNNEAKREEAWQVSDAPEKFISALGRGIVGLRMEVERLDGKWKINQNKTPQDRDGTRDGLQTSGEMGQQLAAHLSENI